MLHDNILRSRINSVHIIVDCRAYFVSKQKLNSITDEILKCCQEMEKRGKRITITSVARESAVRRQIVRNLFSAHSFKRQPHPSLAQRPLKRLCPARPSQRHAAPVAQLDRALHDKCHVVSLLSSNRRDHRRDPETATNGR